jgi:hypothetical protein
MKKNDRKLDEISDRDDRYFVTAKTQNEVICKRPLRPVSS